MYTREESSRIRQEFWTTFGQYMALQLSADGEKVNWINYKTGIRHITFSLQAENKIASVAIIISHSDMLLQELYFDQLLQMQRMLHEELGEIWDWQPLTTDTNGRIVSKVEKDIAGVNIFNKNDWPELISFFKPRLIALDAFWSTAKYVFEAL